MRKEEWFKVMTFEHIFVCNIFLCLFIIAIIDLRSTTIPDWLNFILLINGLLLGFVRGYAIIDYPFYLFLVSVPLLFISYLTDFITGMTNRRNICLDDIVVLIFSTLSIVPFFYFESIKFAFVCAGGIFMLPFVYSFIVFLVEKKQSDEQCSVVNDEQEYSIGGGDIKLFAVLGLNLGLNAIPVTFLAFWLSFILGVFLKKKRLPLGPFILISAVVKLVIDMI